MNAFFFYIDKTKQLLKIAIEKLSPSQRSRDLSKQDKTMCKYRHNCPLTSDKQKRAVILRESQKQMKDLTFL